jgi:hypothetical protein
MLVVGLALMAGQVASGAAVTLQSLVDGASIDPSQGGSIICGDKIFYNFHNVTQSATGTGSLVALDQIFVDCIVGGPNNDEHGIRFSSSEWVIAGIGAYDLGLDFMVKRVDGLPLIHDNTLEFTGGIDGDAETYIAENVRDHSNDDDLADKLVFITPTGSQTSDHKIFTHPAAILDISKDFQMASHNDNSRVFVSHFDQTFSQIVPEPGSIAMVGVGLLGVLGMAARKRRASSN